MFLVFFINIVEGIAILEEFYNFLHFMTLLTMFDQGHL